MAKLDTSVSTIDLFLSKQHGSKHKFGPDSYYLEGFFTDVESQQIFEDLKREGPWVDPALPAMQIRGHPLKRQKFFLVAGEPSSPDESLPTEVPKYTYPGQTWESMLYYKTLGHVRGMTEIVQRFHGLVNINHVIGTRYRNGNDMIGEKSVGWCVFVSVCFFLGWHDDKMADIRPNTYIAICSFGATRDLLLRRKDDEKECARIAVQAGSLFLLGPQTNAEYQHCIPPLKSGEHVDERISLVLRDIKTFVKLSDIKKKAAAAPFQRSKRLITKELKRKRKREEEQEATEKCEGEEKRLRSLIVVPADSVAV